MKTLVMPATPPEANFRRFFRSLQALPRCTIGEMQFFRHHA
jgi:hypothetical protein